MTAVKGEETKDAITVLHLDLWKDEDLPDIARQIREIIARGIDSDTPKAAMETANQLDALCPPHDQASDSQDPENYMWNIWHIIMDIAGSHDVTLKMQGGIIRTIQAFQQIEERHLNSVRRPFSSHGVRIRIINELWTLLGPQVIRGNSQAWVDGPFFLFYMFL